MPKKIVFTPSDPVVVAQMNALLQDGQIVSSGGESETDVMSQKAVTTALNQKANKNDISLNGATDGAPKFYAPTSGGNSGQVLTSKGTLAPVWANPSSITAGACSGNAATSTKLQTARKINGKAFDGAADITTENWGAARNVTLTDGTNTGDAVSVNGSASVSLKLPAKIKADLEGKASSAITADFATKAGAADKAMLATTATKLGTDTVGSYNNPLYLSGGSPIEIKSVDRTAPQRIDNTNGQLITERAVYFGLPNINGYHSYNSASNYYAPTTSGTSGNVLVSGGTNKAPIWQAAQNVYEKNHTSGTGQGYMTFTNGLKIQWGKTTPAQNGTNIPFHPSVNFINIPAIFGTCTDFLATNKIIAFKSCNVTKTGFTAYGMYSQNTSGQTSGDATFFWLAIGF